MITFLASVVLSPALALGQTLEKVDVFPIALRASRQFAKPGQYAVAIVSNPGPAVSAGELSLAISGNREKRSQSVPALEKGQTLSVNLSLPATAKPAKITVALKSKKKMLDSKEVETKRPAPFTFYLLPSTHLCFGWITGEPTEHWGAAQIIRIALHYLDKYPNYTSNIEAMYFLKDYLDKYPEDHARVAKYLREGRLYAGGWMSPFQNIIFAEEETHVRQLTMAQWWLKREFRLTAPVVIDFDAAALHVQTARMFSKAGINAYFRGRYGRGFEYGKTPDAPAEPHGYFTQFSRSLHSCV